MAKRKKLRQNKKVAKKSESKVLNETIKAYKSSMKQLKELENRGFVFKETFKKKLYNSIVNMKKPNAKTRDFYKKMSYKKELYQQSKGFELYPNKIVSVKEGKRVVRQHNKEKKEQNSKVEEIRNAVHQFDDGITVYVDGGKGNTRLMDISEEISELDDILDKMEMTQVFISDSFKEEIIDDIGKLEYGYDDLVIAKINVIKAKLKGGSSEVKIDDMSLIGTPFEGTEE